MADVSTPVSALASSGPLLTPGTSAFGSVTPPSFASATPQAPATAPVATPAAITPSPSTTQSTNVTTLGGPTVSSSQLPPQAPVTQPTPPPDLSTIINQNSQPSPEEGQLGTVTKQINDLTGQLSGQGDYANNLNEKYNVDQNASLANDLGANIAQIQAQRDSLFQQYSSANKNYGIGSYLDFQTKMTDGELSAKQAAYTATLAAVNGKLSTAKGLIDTAIKNKYDPIVNQINALKSQGELISSTLTREQTKQLAVMNAQLADRTAQITANKAIANTMLEKIAVAAANAGNPAPSYIVSQAQSAALGDNPASALAIISPYLNDPLAAKQEIADIQAKNASAAASYASADKSKADAAKVRATTPNALTGQGYDALSIRRYTMASNAIVKNYIENPGYKLVTQGAPYLTKIQAAINTPGSVSDQDLLDSITKLNQGGSGQVTEAQVNTILHGSSLSDKVNTWSKQLGKGGVLSDDQRKQIQDLASATFKGYEKLYQPVYNAATKQLKDAGIPKSFWTIPDSVALANQAMGDNGTAGLPDPTAVQAAAPAGQIAITRNGVPGFIPPAEFDPETDNKL